LIYEKKTKIFVYADGPVEHTNLEILFWHDLLLEHQTTIFTDARTMLEQI